MQGGQFVQWCVTALNNAEWARQKTAFHKAQITPISAKMP